MSAPPISTTPDHHQLADAQPTPVETGLIGSDLRVSASSSNGSNGSGGLNNTFTGTGASYSLAWAQYDSDAHDLHGRLPDLQSGRHTASPLCQSRVQILSINVASDAAAPAWFFRSAGTNSSVGTVIYGSAIAELNTGSRTTISSSSSPIRWPAAISARRSRSLPTSAPTSGRHRPDYPGAGLGQPHRVAEQPAVHPQCGIRQRLVVRLERHRHRQQRHTMTRSNSQSIRNGTLVSGSAPVQIRRRQCAERPGRRDDRQRRQCRDSRLWRQHRHACRRVRFQWQSNRVLVRSVAPDVRPADAFRRRPDRADLRQYARRQRHHAIRHGHL